MLNYKSILITGCDGFIAKNLIEHLRELDLDLLLFNKKNSIEDLKEFIGKADFIFHLAGENRPDKPISFKKNNFLLTETICNIAYKTNPIPICFTSSTQALLKNDYGISKLSAERLITKYTKKTSQKTFIYRLPGVFGKWSKPNYNSVVSTFCYNIANNIDINIHDPSIRIDLVYVDNLINSFINLLTKTPNKQFIDPPKKFNVSLGLLAKKIQDFHINRKIFFIDQVGSGLTRALYSTYLSYLPKEDFSYANKVNEDDRGIFSEIIKTKNSGQVSFFTAKPNITRGIHYHHTKTEKFTVIKGKARLKFKNILTGETHKINVSSEKIVTIDTIPGWTHDITNTGKEELIVLLWANEIFDEKAPDTYHRKT